MQESKIVSCEATCCQDHVTFSWSQAGTNGAASIVIDDTILLLRQPIIVFLPFFQNLSFVCVSCT